MIHRAAERLRSALGHNGAATTVLVAVAGVLAGAYFLAMAAGSARWAMPAPNGYYAYLTEAFLAGQTHLTLEPDRGLLLLENPYAGYQGVPRLHDATYFDGKYYLYYGTPPVFLLFGPWYLLTGTYLADMVGSGIFGYVGFLIGAWLLVRIREWYLPTAGTGWLAAALLLWGLGSFAQCLPYHTNVYGVPISCAYAMITATLAFLLKALRNPSRWRWMALAGTTWGLAIAARPGYLLSLIAAVPAGWYLLRARHRLPPEQRIPVMFSAAALITPIALAGAALAWYNAIRFGSPFEFGTTYMLAGRDQREAVMTDPGNMLSGLQALLFSPVGYSNYFPFVIPSGGLLGALIYCPVVAIVLFLPEIRGRTPSDAPLFLISVCTVVAVTNLLVLSALPPPLNDRYLVDFLPPALIAALITTLILVSRSAAPSRTDRLLRAAVVLTGLWTVAHAAGMNFFFLRDQPLGTALARVFNRPTGWIETITAVKSGPVRLHIRLPEGPVGSSWPLATSANGNDILYVRMADAGAIQIGFMHVGAGGPISLPLKIDRTREQVFELDLGSLYPPAEHPALAKLSEAEAHSLKRRLRVTLNGQVALNASSQFYPGDPGDVQYGANPTRYVTGRNRLSINRIERLGLEEGLRALPSTFSGPLRFKLRFPPYVTFATDPLIGTGKHGAGDVFYVSYVGPNRLRFGHDAWGSGKLETIDVDYDPAKEYTLEVDLGSLHPPLSGPPEPRPFQVLLDDSLIISTPRIFSASEPASLAIGVNSIGSSIVSQIFTGQILSVEPIPAIEIPAPERYGALALWLRFPIGRDRRQEPLLTTGRTGAGDFVYLRYVDAGSIQIGYDHWNVGGPLSDPIAVDFNAINVVEISTGALYPEASDPWWGNVAPETRSLLRSTVTVSLNGKTVLTHRSTPYPAESSEVTPLLNAIGGSTVEPAFSGLIDRRESRRPGRSP